MTRMHTSQGSTAMHTSQGSVVFCKPNTKHLHHWRAWLDEASCPPLQGEAIAVNLREMFGFRVPILSVVIGEGGSGGALAIGCANRNLIMEHSVYYVASPEACAAILWKARGQSSHSELSVQLLAVGCMKLLKRAAQLQSQRPVPVAVSPEKATWVPVWGHTCLLR